MPIIHHFSPHGVFGPLFFFLCFAKLLLKGTGQLIEQTNLLAVLQEACGGRGLVCKKHEQKEKLTLVTNIMARNDFLSKTFVVLQYHKSSK